MADDAKNPTADKSVDEKGQAKDEQVLPATEADKTEEKTTSSTNDQSSGDQDNTVSDVESTHDNSSDDEAATGSDVSEDIDKKDDDVATDIPEAEIVENTQDDNSDPAKTADPETTPAAKVKSKSVKSKKSHKTAPVDPPADKSDFQAEVRDQIENCKFEIVAALQESVHTELKNIMQGQVRKTERRRVFGVVIRDILILILIFLAGFFAYRLYEYGEFDFLLPACTRDNSCEKQPDETTQPDPEPEVVKDLAWYQKNYGSLFDNLQLHLDADKIDAYYLYSGDYKVNEIAPEYLLGMAYNQLSISPNSDNSLVIPTNNLRTAFANTFGTTDNFAKRNFTHDCYHFTYDKNNDIFTAPNSTCNNNSARQILEEITSIYEEGNALYFLTVATIYDQTENSYYSFDNLFQPIATNVTETDLKKHTSQLNQYQYQFKRTDNDHFYFSGIIKLK